MTKQAASKKKEAETAEVIPPEEAKTTGKGTGIYKDSQQILELMEQGYSIEHAVKVVKNKDNVPKDTALKIKKKFDKWSLSRPAMVKLADRAVKETLKMTPIATETLKRCLECKGVDPLMQTCPTCAGTGVVREMLYPSHTNRLAAAAMVKDREEPIVRHSVNIETKILKVDVSSYQSPPTPQDVVVKANHSIADDSVEQVNDEQ